MLLLAPVTSIGFVGIAFVKYIWHLTALRTIIGVTDGAMFTILPMYIGEIVDPDIREFLSSSTCYLFIMGTLLITSIGPIMSIFASSLLVSIIPAIHFILMLMAPETPYYYVKIGEYELAKESIRKLKGEDDISSLADLKEFVIKSNELVTDSKFVNLFTFSSYRKSSLIYFILIFTNRMSGKTPIMMFTSTIFLESGSTINATLSAIIYNVVELIVVCVFTSFFVDRFGSRYLSLISSSGCFVSILLLAVYFCLKETGSSIVSSLNWLPILSLVSYNIMFSIGIGFTPTTYLTELFPMNIKSNAMCLAQIFTVSLSWITILSNYF